MRLSLLFLFFVGVTASLFSQTYSVQGIIMNEANEPVEAVTCILRSTTDSMQLHTVVTDGLGQFKIGELSNGNYILTLQHMAYENEQHSLVIENAHLEIPPFALLSLSKQLNEVTVRGERPVVKAEAGKLVYDVPVLVKNKTVSNAFETLQNVPNIVGVGDDLQLVGSSGYTILINGQLTSMSKDQLITLLKSTPASRVANVEIMYSAPPQYNVRGAAINIILKEQTVEMSELQGEGSLEYKQAHYAAFGARGNLLYTKPWFNADLTVGIGKSKGWEDNNMYAKHQFDGHTYDITQDNNFSSNRKDLNLRLGLGYTLANKDKIRMVYTSAMDDYASDPTSNTVFLQDSNPFTNVKSQNDKDGNSYLHNIKTEYNSHKNLNVGIDYTSYKDPATEKYYEYTNGTILQASFKTKTLQNVNKIVAFANHSVSLDKGWELNYGGNYSFSNNDNKYDYYKKPENQKVDSINDSKQKEYGGSVFAGFTKSFGEKLSTQASISANYFRAEIDIMGNKKTLWNDFQPFVNANLTYTYNPQRILQFSFSSDIDYPPYWALSTDQFKINAYSLAIGNPELKFSREYKTQLVFIMNQKYMAGSYYEYVPDKYIQLPYQSQDRLENVFQMVNLDYSKTYGIFFVVPVAIDKVWDAKATVNLMRQEQKDDNFYDTPYKRSKNTFVLQANNTFNISSKPNIKLDVSAFYMHGAMQGIFDIGQMKNVDAGAKWTFLNNNAELLFKVDDIFKSGKQTTKIDYMSQYSTMRINPNAPMFKLSFTYRFGGYKKPKVEEVDTSRFGR